MRTLFRPNAPTLVLFLLFALIAIGGSIQAGAFGPDEGPRQGERFLSLPLWETWVLIGAPVHVLFSRAPRWLYFVAQAVYFYVLAALVVAIARRRRNHRRGAEDTE
jgi:hypothetical protein